MSFLDRLDDEALRVRAAPFLAGRVPAHGLRVDVASGVTSFDVLSRNVHRVTFATGVKALCHRDIPDLLDADELGTATARAAGLHPPEVYRASDGELYTAPLPDTAVVGIDLPDLPAGELRALLDRFGTPTPAAIADADLGEWAQAALLNRTRAGQQLRTVDAITGTVARHPGEWAVDGNRLIPLGFPGAWRSVDAPTLDADLPDVENLRSVVDGLRPQFVHRRRAAWHDRTIAALGMGLA